MPTNLRCVPSTWYLGRLQEAFEFWSAYNNPMEPLFKGFYSDFLKANNQVKGIESYSYVVALLVDYIQGMNLERTLLLQS